MDKKKEQFLLFRLRAFSDERAFGGIVNAYKDQLNRFFYLKLPAEHVEDALSETFLKLWDYVTRTSVDSLGGLIFTIARSIVADFYKKDGKRSHEVSMVLEDGEMQIEDPLGEDIISTVDAKLLLESMRSLKEEYVQVLMLKYEQGLKSREIGEIIGKTEATTNVVLSRARQALRDLIHERFGDL